MKNLRTLGTLFVGMLAACEAGGVVGEAGVVNDAATPEEAGPDVVVSFPDSAPIDAAASTSFYIFTTQTYSSPGGDPPADWGGVLRYVVADTGGIATPGPAIDKALVADPFSLAFRKTTAEVFVGNRHGCLSGDGIPGSISRFLYTASDGTLTPNGAILDVDGDMQVVFDPLETELYAAHCNTGISKFALDSTGKATADGVMATGLVFPRGLAVSPDGKRLYVSTASYTIYEYDTATGNQITSIAVSDTGAYLHEMSLFDHELYVGDIVDNYVYHFHVSPSDDLVFVEKILADNPISVAFSLDGKELFATASRGVSVPTVIDRFMKGDGGTWNMSSQIKITGSSLGGTLVFPTNAVPAPIK